MPHSSGLIGLKLARALEHFHSLETEVAGFVKSENCRIIPDFKSEPGYLVVKVHQEGSPSPFCSIYIGEILYHFRSALDQLVCFLTEENGQVVDDNREFPIFRTREHFRDPSTGALKKGIIDRIGGLSDKHQAIIEREQPFQGKYGTPEDDPLWWLYCLSNFDRHKFLHLVSVVTLSGHEEFLPKWFTRYLTQVSSSYGAFENETEVSRFRIDPAANELEPVVAVQVKSQISFDVAFDKEGPGAGRPVTRTIKAIAARVTDIMKELVR